MITFSHNQFPFQLDKSYYVVKCPTYYKNMANILWLNEEHHIIIAIL